MTAETAKTVLHLSQSNLQDFSECPRRFELKVIDQISWPAAYLEPLSQLEQATEIGNMFHQLCYQFFSGVDQLTLSQSISSPDLKIMWENFSSFVNDIEVENLFPEIILSTPFLGHQLIAKFDLLLKTNDDKYIIYDWKTSSKKPTRTLLSNRFQTFLYPFVFVRSGNNIFDNEMPSPNNIIMKYWYPMSSDPEETFPYSDTVYLENTGQLTKIISEIDDFGASGEQFPLTKDWKVCGKCVYRSLCERGNEASKLDPYTDIAEEDLSGIHFDLDNIGEIEF